MKAFNVTEKYVLYEVSYANMLLYLATLPSYDSIKKDKEGNDAIDADDPANRARVEQILLGGH